MLVATGMVAGSLLVASGTTKACRAGLHVKRSPAGIDRCVAVAPPATWKAFRPLQPTKPTDPRAERSGRRIALGVGVLSAAVVFLPRGPGGVSLHVEDGIRATKTITW